MRYLLREGEVLTLQPDQSVDSITLSAGRLWLTRSEDNRDFCLEAGSRLPVRKGETLYIEALAPCTLDINTGKCRAAVRITCSWSNPDPRPA